MNKKALPFFCLYLVLSSFGFAAQKNHFQFSGRIPEVPSISQQEGFLRLQAFCNFRYDGDFSLKFSLIHMPRANLETYYFGTLWASWNEKGPITRVQLKPANNPQGEDIELLIQNGPAPNVWLKKNGQEVRELSNSELMHPLADPLLYTPFDLQMNFIFWPKFKYEGPQRFRGRAAQTFQMIPPENLSSAIPQLGTVNLIMDDYYNAMLEAELADKSGKILRAMKILDFQKVQGEYIIQRIDLVDDKTHDKTRFQVNAAAMNLRIPDDFFEPSALGSDYPHIPSSRYSQLN